MKPTEDFRGGTIAAKTSPLPYDRSGVAGTGAPEELKFDGCLLQENKAKSQNKKRCSTTKKQENNSPTHDKGRIIILIFLILRHSNHSAI